MKNILIISIFAFLASCSIDKNKTEKKYKDFFNINPTSEINIALKNIEMDSIPLDYMQSSYSGKSIIHDNKIMFIDSYFCWGFVFNLNGKLLSRTFGQGKGPKEIPTGFIDAFSVNDKGEFLFIGSSWDYHLFNSKGYRVNSNTIKFLHNISESELLKLSDPTHTAIYTLSWEKLNVWHDNNYAYFTIYSDNEALDFCSDEEYYKQGRVMAKMNIKTGEIEKIMGRRPPIYLKNKFIPQIAYMDFDMLENSNLLFVTHQADPVIYQYDLDFNLKMAFGVEGENMNTNYTKINSRMQVMEAFKHDQKNCGKYEWIKFIESTNILFRGYTKGRDKPNGLQIYQNGVLVADIEVPDGFEVDSYIEPYYYSKVLADDEKELAYFFKFKLALP